MLYIFTYLSTPQLLHNRQSLGYSTHCGTSALCLTCISSLPSLTCPSHAVFLEELGILRVPTWCVTAFMVTVPSALVLPLRAVPILRTWFSSAVSYAYAMHTIAVFSKYVPCTERYSSCVYTDVPSPTLCLPSPPSLQVISHLSALNSPPALLQVLQLLYSSSALFSPSALALDASLPALNLDGSVSVTIITSLSTMAICANKLYNPLSFRQLNVSHYYLC